MGQSLPPGRTKRAAQPTAQLRRPGAAGKGRVNCDSAEAGTRSARPKNDRAEEMIILLLDANRTVNGVITGVFSGPPLPPPVNSGLSRCTLSDSLGWCHPRVLGVSGKRVCLSGHPRNEGGWVLRKWPMRETVAPKDLGAGPSNVTSRETRRRGTRSPS